LCALREGLIHSSTGIIHDQAAGKYLLETSWGWGKYTTAAARIFNGRVHRISSAKPLYVFSSVGYHGIVEDLSAILALQERGHRFDVILEKRNSWMSKLVQLFLPADDSVIQTEAGVWISAPNLLITTKSAFGEFPHPDLLATLRRGARRLEGKSAFAPRLFISRGDAPSRTCPEETRIAEHYRGRGYQTLRLSEIHVRDQVLALREATAVAGLHGAGLTNLVWGQKAIRVHELYFSSWFNSCYACLSHSLGHSYHNLKIDPDAAGGTDPLQRLTDLPDDGWPASAASPARS
jgi:capsular polysaccharide biosynthesis protein